MAKNKQTATEQNESNETQAATATAESAKPKRVRVKLPEATEAELNAYFGEGEEGEKNRAEALVSVFDAARTRAAKAVAGDADLQEFINSDKFGASYATLKFGKRNRKGGKGGTRKVKRSAADLEKAIAVVGMPTTQEELAALLLSLNVELTQPEASAS